MPNSVGRRGWPANGAVAAPSKREQTVRSGGSQLPVAGTRYGATHRGPLRSTPLSSVPQTISGVTRDASGTPLASCTVWLFNTRTKAFLGEVISDGSGAFTFGFSGPCFAIAYSSDGAVAGVTLNTLSAG